MMRFICVFLQRACVTAAVLACRADLYCSSVISTALNHVPSNVPRTWTSRFAAMAVNRARVMTWPVDSLITVEGDMNTVLQFASLWVNQLTALTQLAQNIQVNTGLIVERHLPKPKLAD